MLSPVCRDLGLLLKLSKPTVKFVGILSATGKGVQVIHEELVLPDKFFSYTKDHWAAVKAAGP